MCIPTRRVQRIESIRVPRSIALFPNAYSMRTSYVDADEKNSRAAKTGVYATARYRAHDIIIIYYYHYYYHYHHYCYRSLVYAQCKYLLYTRARV